MGPGPWLLLGHLLLELILLGYVVQLCGLIFILFASIIEPINYGRGVEYLMRYCPLPLDRILECLYTHYHISPRFSAHGDCVFCSLLGLLGLPN